MYRVGRSGRAKVRMMRVIRNFLLILAAGLVSAVLKYVRCHPVALLSPGLWKGCSGLGTGKRALHPRRSGAIWGLYRGRCDGVRDWCVISMLVPSRVSRSP